MRCDITGKRFGKLVAIEPVGKDKRNNVLWLCKCDCGNECTRAVSELHKRNNHSCGCSGKEHLKTMSQGNITHLLDYMAISQSMESTAVSIDFLS